MRTVAVFACAVLLTCLGAIPSRAEKRVALVVGNERYANLPADQQLRKAVNDARAVGDALKRLGFEVIRGENLGRQALVDKFEELTGRLAPGDTAFFFFAGHGVAIGGGNYILPVDVPNVEAGQDMRLARASLGESDIVSDLQGRGVRVAVVVLDACRNNPFKRPGVRSVGAERGLGRIEPVRGVFTLYSAGIGQMALDRLGDTDNNPNSVFTRVFVPVLTRPGLGLGDLAIEVREDVARLAASVKHDQRPAYYDETIGGRVYLAGLPRDEAKPEPPKAASGQSEAERAWAAVNETTSITVLEDFIRRYGDSIYGTLARARLDELKKSQVAAVAPPVVPAVPAGRRGAGALDGHLLIQPLESPLTDWQRVAERVGKVEGIELAAPIVEGHAVASSPFSAAGVVLRGVRAADLVKLPSVANNIRQGTLDGFDGGQGVAIGRRLADQLSLRAGDSVTLVAPRGAVTQMGTPRNKSYKIAAVFEIGMSDYDAAFVFMPLPEAQAYFNRAGDVTAIEVYIDNPDRIDRYRKLVADAANRPIFMIDWRQRNWSFFNALQVECREMRTPH